MSLLRRRCISPARVAIAMLAAAAPAFNAQAQTVPKATAAWARPTVPGQAGGGAYLTLIGGAAPDRLVGARSDIAQDVQLHSMAMDGSVMHMRQVPAVDVPAGKTVVFGPGGYHVMFMGLKRPLKVGDRIPLTLHFEKAGDVAVEVEVATQNPSAAPGGAAMPMK